MKHKLFLLVALGLIFSEWGFSQVSFGESVKINDGWMFKNKEIKDEFSQKSDDESWRTVNLPHDWSVEGPHSPQLASCTGYLPGGIGWYKKDLTFNEADKGKQIYIYFGGVMNNSEVSVNGKLLGKRPNGYVSFMYDLTPHLDFEKPNQILVKVDHSLSADSRWYNGSGIYRDVYLIKSGAVHIDQWGISCTPTNISKKSADLQINTSIKNNSKQLSKLTIVQKLYKKGSSKVITTTQSNLTVAAGTVQSIDQKIKVLNPAIWSVKNPELYTVETIVLEKGKVIDQNKLTTGIRTIRFDANKGFFLNDENMKLKGVCIHHDAGALGAAVPKVVWERRLKALKEIGCNAIRTSHNPQDDVVYDLCDELGFVVMDEAFDEWEFPKRKWLEGWNVGSPGYQGYATYFNEWAEKDITDQVKMHKNHPSIIMWSIGNEVDYPNDPYSHPSLNEGSIGQKAIIGYKPEQPNAERLGVIAKKLVAAVKKGDTTRPVTGALAGVIMSNHTDYPFVLDVTGYNYTENRYAMDHEKYPNRVLYGSENRHDKAAWNIVTQNDYVAGQFLWTGFDYLGEAGAWPSRGFGSGVMDIAGNMKPMSYYRQSLWSEKPMVYIGTMPERGRDFMYQIRNNWNYKQGDNVKVACFSNCEKVEIALNGKKIETEIQMDKNTGARYWIVPFEPGVITANGFNNNQLAASYKLETTGRPERITCKPYTSTVSGNRAVAQIEVQIVDQDGKPVFLSDNEITCRVKGPGKVIGMENADMSDMTNFQSNRLRVHQGRMLVFVETTAASGSMEIEFTSPWLQAGKTTIEIN